jgi:hypothetical protein
MNEFQIREALRGMRNQIEVPPLDRAKEDALLAAFDGHMARAARPPAGRWVWAAATAASVAVAVALNFVVATNVRDRAQAARGSDSPSQPSSAASITADDAGGFVPWPGASTLPRFESGALMRIDVPVSALPALGFAPPSRGTSVQADVIVGQDGMARAIRLVQ